jgi:hypothetical protein
VSNYYFSGQVSEKAEISINRNARYVRIQLTEANYLSLAEVKVFGSSNSTTFHQTMWSGVEQGVKTSTAEIAVSLPMNITSGSGRSVEVPVTVGDLTGSNIQALDFSVFYNQAVLQPSITFVSSDRALSQNCTFLAHSPAPGKINVSGTCPFPPINSGSGTLFNLNFDVIGSSGQQSELSFINPADNQSMFVFNEETPAKTTSGLLTVIAPTAAPVTVGGRVRTPNGRSVPGAKVTLTDFKGITRIAVANVFGYYRFADLNAGETYVLSVSAKRLKFTPQTQIRTITEDSFDINFTSDR